LELKELTESAQSYLEVILELETTQKVARAKDIAERLGVQRGSVSGALKSLEEKGLIHYQPYSYITLTAIGKEFAGEIVHRHAVLRDFLLNVLQIDEKTADATACRMEHVIDKKTVERLVCFIEYINTCPRAGKEWLDSFTNFCKTEDKDRQNCQRCIDDLKNTV
jgi:DtxR family Mn-dependent transcriptional regulator